MALTFAVESLQANWDAAWALAREHWHETEAYRHGQEFNPDRQRYAQVERGGWFLFVAARAPTLDGNPLVGYFSFYLMPSMHTQKLVASEDFFFLLPAFRKGRNAINCLKFVIEECRRRGAVELTVTAKLSNNVGRLIEYLGAKPVSTQYSLHL